MWENECENVACFKRLNPLYPLPQAGNPADWPKDLDPVISAKKNHKILMESNSVRELSVTVLPGKQKRSIITSGVVYCT
jgi:hypothetical protein